jgi:hypothetical protein
MLAQTKNPNSLYIAIYVELIDNVRKLSLDELSILLWSITKVDHIKK